jgi:uncharacterized OB-fold protein
MKRTEIDRIECAIRHIESSIDVDSWAMEIAVEAMEKQVPKKPKIPMDAYWLCPTCGRKINYPFEYCVSCGQAIDWTEGE